MPTAEKISTLWILVLFNMAFADILGFIYPGFLAEVMTGQIDGIILTPTFILIAAIFIEIAIIMIFLTRALRPALGRTLNLIAVIITIAFIVGGGSLSPHYIFFASIEVITLLYIGWLAWSWRESDLANTTTA